MAFKLSSSAFSPGGEEASKAKLEAAMKPHLIAQADPIGTYRPQSQRGSRT
jgi:hypothetical protein